MEAVGFLIVLIGVPLLIATFMYLIAAEIYKRATGRKKSNTAIKRDIKEAMRVQLWTAQAEKEAAQELINEYNKKGKF